MTRHPGLGLAILLSLPGMGLGALGIFFFATEPMGAMAYVLGVAFCAWAISLVTPLVIMLWYIRRAAWQRPREARGRKFTVAAAELDTIGMPPLRRGWGRLVFTGPTYDGPRLRGLTTGRVIIATCAVIMLLAGAIAGLSRLAG